MIDVDALKAEWVKKGLKQYEVAKMLNMTPKTLSIKLKKGVLGSDEIETLIDKLDISKPMNIFFGRQ